MKRKNIFNKIVVIIMICKNIYTTTKNFLSQSHNFIIKINRLIPLYLLPLPVLLLQFFFLLIIYVLLCLNSTCIAKLVKLNGSNIHYEQHTKLAHHNIAITYLREDTFCCLFVIYSSFYSIVS